MDAILDSLSPLQLPPLQLGQLENQLRDRPLPLEPSARRELFTKPTTSQYGERQQATQSPLPNSCSQQSPGGNRTLVSIADLQEQIKQPMNDGLQSAEILGTVPGSAGINNQPSINTLIAQGEDTVDTTTRVASPGTQISSSESATHTLTRTYPAILPWTDDVEQKSGRVTKSQGSPAPQKNVKSGKTRRKWTAEETRDLLAGCAIHGVGNWKKVLEDVRFNFNNRSSVDLKDRFRTCFPEEYKNHLGKKAQTSNGAGKVSDLSNLLADSEHASTGTGTKYKRKNSKKRNMDSPVNILEKYGCPNNFPKAQRRERKPFTPDEDEALLRGFQMHGALWSKIQGDKNLSLSHRRSTDLRDRFRNAYPERYEQAGFKARSKNPPKPPRSGPSCNDGGGSGREAREGDIPLSNIMESEQPSTSMSPTDEHNQQQYGVQDITDHLDDFDLENLGKSSTLDVDDRGDHEDDPSRKSDDFNVATMMQDLLRDNSLRDWEDSNEPIGTDSSSLFSVGNRNESPPGSSMTVEATLSEEFCSNALTQFDEQSFLNTATATSNMNNNNNNKSTSSDAGSSATSAHDLVRWEDMVTHPIFVLEASIPAPPVSASSHPLSQHLHHNHSLPGLDEVTLAPLNPQLFGVRGPQGSVASIGLPSLVGSNSLTQPLNLSGPQGIEGFDDGGVMADVPTGTLSSVSELLQQHTDHSHSALTSLELPPLDEHLVTMDVTNKGKKRRKAPGQAKPRKGKEKVKRETKLARVEMMTSTTEACGNKGANSRSSKTKKRKLDNPPSLTSPSLSPTLSAISSPNSINPTCTASATPG